MKEIQVIYDLGSLCKINKIEIWFVKSTNKCGVQDINFDFSKTGDKTDDWCDRISRKNQVKLDKNPQTYPIKAENLNKVARYVKITCSSRLAMMALGEIKIFGERTAEKKSRIKITV